MPRTHRPYPPEFRAEAVRLARGSDKSIPVLAADLGVSPEELRHWLRQADADEGRGQPGDLTTDEREDLRRLRREVSARVQAEGSLSTQIAAAHARSRGRYGAPRIHAMLRAAGVRTSRRRVARLMRATGLAGCCPHRRVRTTVAAPAPNRLWRGDSTFVPKRTHSAPNSHAPAMFEEMLLSEHAANLHAPHYPARGPKP